MNSADLAYEVFINEPPKQDNGNLPSGEPKSFPRSPALSSTGHVAPFWSTPDSQRTQRTRWETGSPAKAVT